MTARGHPAAPGMMRHGPPPGVGASSGHHPREPPELAAQVAEIEHLLMENRRLAATILTMRQDLAAAREEMKRLKSHIRSTETESDIEIRLLLDKILKMESGIKAGESVKTDLQQAHKEAQSLVAARKELILKIQQASQELEKYHTDITNVPDMISELDSMRLEHQRLRSAFEHEKSRNLDLVKRMQAMENNLVGMSREVETLRAEVLKAEKRVQAPYGGAHPNQDLQYPPAYQSNDPYYDSYRRAHVQMAVSGAMEGTVSHGNVNGPSPGHGIGASPVSSPMAPTAWGGSYDPNIVRK